MLDKVLDSSLLYQLDMNVSLAAPMPLPTFASLCFAITINPVDKKE